MNRRRVILLFTISYLFLPTLTWANMGPFYSNYGSMPSFIMLWGLYSAISITFRKPDFLPFRIWIGVIFGAFWGFSALGHSSFFLDLTYLPLYTYLSAVLAIDITGYMTGQYTKKTYIAIDAGFWIICIASGSLVVINFYEIFSWPDAGSLTSAFIILAVLLFMVKPLFLRKAEQQKVFVYVVSVVLGIGLAFPGILCLLPKQMGAGFRPMFALNLAEALERAEAECPGEIRKSGGSCNEIKFKIYNKFISSDFIIKILAADSEKFVLLASGQPQSSFRRAEGLVFIYDSRSTRSSAQGTRPGPLYGPYSGWALISHYSKLYPGPNQIQQDWPGLLGVNSLEDMLASGAPHRAPTIFLLSYVLGILFLTAGLILVVYNKKRMKVISESIA